MPFPQGPTQDFGELARQLFCAPGVTDRSTGRAYPLVVSDPASLVITSGTLVVDDPDSPFADADDVGLSVSVKPGPVRLENAAVVVSIPDPQGRLVDYRSVAMIRITVQDEAVAHWSRAAEASGRPAVVSVNHGFVSFWDLDSRAAVEHLKDSFDELDEVERSIRVRGDLMPTIARDGHHVVLAKAGPGADNYPVWIGKTQDNQVGQIVIEMLPFDWTHGAFAR